MPIDTPTVVCARAAAVTPRESANAKILFMVSLNGDVSRMQFTAASQAPCSLWLIELAIVRPFPPRGVPPVQKRTIPTRRRARRLPVGANTANAGGARM